MDPIVACDLCVDEEERLKNVGWLFRDRNSGVAREGLHARKFNMRRERAQHDLRLFVAYVGGE